MTKPLSSEMVRAWRVAEVTDAACLESLVNGAYRGETGRQGWTTEAHIIGGQRTSVPDLQPLLSGTDGVVLIGHPAREPSQIRGCVHVKRMGAQEPAVAYFGMLTVDVKAQNEGWGLFLLRAAEDYARSSFGAQRMEMTVISIRRELIEWYQRHGYRATGEKRPFPYGDERFGRPLVSDLEFDVFTKDL